MKIYLAGPMRGIPEFNFPAFDDAAARGRRIGHEIISPAEMDRAHGFSEKGQDGKVNEKGHNQTVTLDFMRSAAHRDFFAIVGTPEKPGVHAVAMLPGWERSKGARAEKALAEWVGLEVLDAETFGPIGQTFAEVAPIKNGQFVVKDSGHRTQFETGAVRDDGVAKGYFHCIPFVAIEALARLYEAGAKKYGKDNWRKGIPLSRYIDAIFRHAFKLSEGWQDEDHAAAAAWNVFGFIWTATAIKAGKLPASLNDIDYPMEKKA